MIRILGVELGLDFPSHIEIDEYVPIQFQSYNGSLGARYLRIGNLKRSMLELTVGQDSLLLRGMTLVFFDKTHEVVEIPRHSRTQGLPILIMPKNVKFKGSEYQPYADIPVDFTVGLGEDFLEMKMADLSKVNRVICFDRVEFLMESDSLAGIRITKLQAAELKKLAYSFAKIKNQG